MIKVLNFPNTEQSEPPEQNVTVYTGLENEHIVGEKHKCYKCSKPLNDQDYVWYINQQAGYSSDIDGRRVDVEVCDQCMMDFLNNK